MLETLKLSLHITRRNWVVYQKDFLANIAPTAFEPMFMLFCLGIGLGAYVNHVDGRTYVEYLAPGLAVSTALFTAFFESSYGFFVRMTYENIFKAMLTTPIGVFEVVLGEFIWVGIKGAVMFSFLAALMAPFELLKNPALLLLCPLVGIIVALPCGALGLLATAFVKNINQFQTVYAFLISPLFFFSGTFFPIEQMPLPARIFAEVLPLHHGVRLAQAMFWNENLAQNLLSHGSILVAYSLVSGALAYKKIRSKLLQ